MLLEEGRFEGNLSAGTMPESICTNVRERNLQVLVADCPVPLACDEDCCSSCGVEEAAPSAPSTPVGSLPGSPVASPIAVAG